jgi:hypothetical protein
MGMAVLIVVLVLAYEAVMAWIIRRQQRRSGRDGVVDIRPGRQRPRRWTPPGDD